MRRILVAGFLHCSSYYNITLIRTGDGAFDEQEVCVTADVDNLEILDGDLLETHVSGHFLAFIGATGGHVLSDGATVPESFVRAVGCRSAAEAVTFHDAGEAFAFGCSRDINEVTGFKYVYGVDGANFIRLEVFRCYLELLEDLRGRDVDFLEMARVGLVDSLDLDDFVKTDLNRVVAFPVRGFFLDYIAWTGFYDRNGDDIPVFIEYLRHT